MPDPFDLRVEAAIADLYTRAAVQPPGERRPIAPLADLLGGHNLVSLEVPALTSRAALDILLRRGGLVNVPDASPDDEALAGYLYATTNHGTIFVRQDDSVERRRFSVAHELGHYLLHFWTLLNPPDPDTEPILQQATDAFTTSQAESDGSSQGDATPEIEATGLLPPLVAMEREADRFAAELLMPRHLVERLALCYIDRRKDDDLSWTLATRMLVSPTAMRVRLRDLGQMNVHLATKEAQE